MRYRTTTKLRAITWDDFGFFCSMDGMGCHKQMHKPDKPSTWTRARGADAISVKPGPDPDWEDVARAVIARAVQDARLTESSMARANVRARQFLREPSDDLDFWCIRAGLEMDNIVRWSRVHLAVDTDPIVTIRRRDHYRRKDALSTAAVA